MITRVKTAVLLFFLVTSFDSVHADSTQDLRNFYNSYLPDFQKLTPEASALGQYGKYDDSGYSGVPNISVPLFSIGSGSFSMSAELCYDASGIKVDQQATYVGLGWNLIMGGSISQIVCGKNDFFQSSFNINPSSISNLDLLQTVMSGIGYSPNYCITGTPSVAFPAVPATPGTCMPVEADRKKFDILRDVANGVRVPDIFQASFCGHSVSFVIDTFNKKARALGNDATCYQIELKDYSGSYPRSIEITDDHGLKYIFTEAPKSSMEDNASYNLSRIKNAAGQSLVEFKYTEAGYSYLQSYYETVGKRDESSNMPIASESIKDLFIKRNYPGTLACGLKVYYPETITTDKEIVTFTYGQREDVKNAKQIAKITVTSNNGGGTILHTVTFKYGYFTESAFESALCNKYRYTSVYGYKRLKLTDVTVDGKKYSFGYNENQNLPSRLSMQQDFWGYYNGQLNTDGLCASPECRYNANGSLVGLDVIGPANRYANEDYCKIGTLNKITYPTGGYTKFYYEIHHFDDVDGKYYYPSANAIKATVKYVRKEICGSGYNGTGYNTTPDTKGFYVDQPAEVEISTSSPYSTLSQQYYKLYFSIVGKDSNGNTIFYRSYTKYNDMKDIKESCVLPKGHYVLTSQFENVSSGLIIGGTIQVSFPPSYREDLSIADASGKSIGGGLRIKTIENYDSDDALIGYTRYKYSGGKLLIPTVKAEHIDMHYLFSSTSAPGVYVIPSTFQCAFFFITSNPTYLAICSLGSPNVGYSKVTKENYDRDGQLMSYDIEKYNNDGYTNAQNNIFRVNMDGLNGKLQESTVYSKDNIPMHKVSYSYTTIGQNPALSDMVFFPWARCENMNPGGSALNVYYKYALYSKPQICVLPSVITETNYVNGSAMKSVTTTYGYKASNYQPASITRTIALSSSIRETSQTKYWYPEDTEVGNSNTACLTGAHCISEKVKAIVYRNGQTVGGYRNIYKALSNGLPVVSKNYSITSSGNEILELDVTDHDDHGNICGYKKKDGTPVSVIWSYSRQLPVMEVVGRTYSELKAFSSVVAKLENDAVATDIIKSTESLHTALQNARIMASAYEYSPWHTVSCIINPNGNKTRYSYDSYGRLEKASDVNNKTLQKYTYNYRIK